MVSMGHQSQTALDNIKYYHTSCYKDQDYRDRVRQMSNMF